ncbi:hypothetical protein [Achromobacter sp. DMS1]|uniref:hypothetical protein n=1 Tax=Achromobacter sp. DMS1 TaxID=1688405 RepID=UPI000A4BCD73|nr:hypothetical protein [Achromobacter sp. DMS1]
MSIETPIRIDFSEPYLVNGMPARYQSLWLLLRIYHAYRSSGTSLSASAIQARFPGRSNFRMLISRAFADFKCWGISVGWGDDPAIEPALLSTRRRSHGPFWMRGETAARLRIYARGAELDSPTLARLLGLPADESMRGDPTGYVMQDVAYWNHLTQAMRVALDGFPSASDRSLAESFRVAQHAATDDFQVALSVLKESLAWRKLGQLERSHEALARLERRLKPVSTKSGLASFSAMAFIARSWNLYMRGKTVAAAAELERLASDPELHLVVRYNPRIRFEYLNLRALLGKAVVLNATDLSGAARIETAKSVMGDFSEALQAAYEADSVEAAQDVAANIGLTLWLFWKDRLIDEERLRDERAVQIQAVRWIGLSEWICDRFGVGGGSAWNTIFLLRIVRGTCRHPGRDGRNRDGAGTPLGPSNTTFSPRSMKRSVASSSICALGAPTAKP